MSSRDSLGIFLDDAGRVPLLTPAQEIHLSRQILRMIDLRDRDNKVYTKTEERAIKIGMKAKDKLIRHNLRLVVHIARKFCARHKFQCMELADFIQEGCLGLDRAAERFDGTKGYKFSTYAHWWIKQALRRAVDNKSRIVRIPVHAMDVLIAIRRFTEEYNRTHNRFPTIPEIAEGIGTTVQWVNLMLERAQGTSSLDIMIGKSGEIDLASGIPDPNTVDLDARYEAMETQDETLFLEAAFQHLSPRERDVIILRYGLDGSQEGKTLAEIGNQLGFCRERSRQLLNRATRRLQHHAHRLTRKSLEDGTHARSLSAAA